MSYGKNDIEIRPILIHIGYSKASSTWLQHRLFMYPERGYWALFPEKTDRETLNRLIVTPSAFENCLPELRQTVERQLAACPDDDLVPVISAEGLVGHHNDPTRALSKMLADRIVAEFPSGKILIIIREQASMVRSFYLDYIRGGGRFSLRRFISRPNIYETPTLTGFHKFYLEYDELIAHYQSLVGPDRVRVLPFEMLQRDPKGYVQAIRKYSGATIGNNDVDTSVVKPAIVTGGIEFRRFMSNFFSNDENNPFSYLLPDSLYWRVYVRMMRRNEVMLRRMGANNPQKLTRKINRLLGDNYVESNRRTASLTGLELEAFDYKIVRTSS